LTILITGASGFLGRRLVEMLRGRGHALRLLLREGSDLGSLDAGDCEIARCSFTDTGALAQAMRHVRTVYHCAGRSSDWGRWAEFRAANLIDAALRAGSVARFVHVSTTDIYGYPETPCDESHGFHDMGLPYNRSKGAGDCLALDFGKRTGLPVTVVRPATIFGPRSKDWVVELARLLIARQAVTVARGKSLAGLVYVDDVVQAMTGLADLPGAAGEAFNVVDPTPVTWRQYFDAIADAVGSPRARLDVSAKTAMTLGWLCEAAYRLLGVRSRPLFTRHVVLLLSRSQHYGTHKLLSALPDFPRVGVAQGLEATAAWLEFGQGRAP
jgi:nucleoside-diphosphate-sugar epimerase